MPRVQSDMGEVIVWDGTNAAELGEAVKDPDGPTVENSQVTLDVPTPTGTETWTLAPGDGLVDRQIMGGYLRITAEQLAAFNPRPIEAEAEAEAEEEPTPAKAATPRRTRA